MQLLPRYHFHSILEIYMVLQVRSCTTFWQGLQHTSGRIKMLDFTREHPAPDPTLIYNCKNKTDVHKSFHWQDLQGGSDAFFWKCWIVKMWIEEPRWPLPSYCFGFWWHDILMPLLSFSYNNTFICGAHLLHMMVLVLLLHTVLRGMSRHLYMSLNQEYWSSTWCRS